MKNNSGNFLSIIMSTLIFLFGDFDFLIKAIIALIFIDYVTGICKAIVTKKINSDTGGKGIVKKVMYLCIISVSVLLDVLLDVNGSLRTIVIYFFIFNEIISIMENCTEIGIKVPNILYKIINNFKDNIDNDIL